MINSNELRRFNLVQDEHGVVQYVYRIWDGGAELVDDKDGSGDLDYTNEEMFGVPLSEKRLLKAGFVESNMGYFQKYFKSRTGGYLSINLSQNTAEICIAGYGFQIQCDKVHLLQNVWLYLTGEELDIKKEA